MQMIHNKLDQLIIENNNLSSELQLLNKKITVYKEKEHHSRFLRGILGELKDTEWINSSDISSKTGVHLDEVDKILKVFFNSVSLSSTLLDAGNGYETSSGDVLQTICNVAFNVGSG